MSKSILQKKRILTKAGGGSSLATPVSVANGGTGISSYAIGDIIYASGATTLSKLPIGTASQQLRVNAGATALEYFTPTGGISIGDTIGNSPVTGSVMMIVGSVLAQSISYRAQQATPFSTSFGFESHSSGSFSGIGNTAIGYQASKATTTALNTTAVGYLALTAQTTSSGNGNNTAFGSNALTAVTTGYSNVGIGYRAGYTKTTGAENIYIGRSSGGTGTNDVWNVMVGNNTGQVSSSASYCTILGGAATNINTTNSIALGCVAVNSANNELMIGGDASSIGGSASGITTVCIGNSNANATASSVTIRTTGGSGSNNAAGIFTIRTGASTGTASTATLRFQTGTVLGSGSTAQTMVSRLIFSQGAVTTDASTATWADALDFVVGSTTGTKFATATTQKIGFWNVTPIVQPTTAYTAATLVGGAGTNITDTDTFDGYTLKQIVAALRGIGLLA